MRVLAVLPLLAIAACAAPMIERVQPGTRFELNCARFYLATGDSVDLTTPITTEAGVRGADRTGAARLLGWAVVKGARLPGGAMPAQDCPVAMDARARTDSLTRGTLGP